MWCTTTWVLFGTYLAEKNPTWWCQVGGFCFQISGKSFARIWNVKIPKHSEAACGGGMRRSVWYSLHILASQVQWYSSLLFSSYSSSCSSYIIIFYVLVVILAMIVLSLEGQHLSIIITLELQFYRRIENPPTGPSQIKIHSSKMKG